ncbi:MAG: S8 family serine peptidase [Phycisphaeraceae bacterium]|nr:S8 family serine peptidase [Phycisphaeraceae bacterium]
MPSRTVSRYVATACALWLVHVANAAGDRRIEPTPSSTSNAKSEAKAQQVPLFGGEQAMMVERIDAKTSIALAPSMIAAHEPAWTLLARVVVRTTDTVRLDEALNAIGRKAKRLDFTAHWSEPYCTIEAASIAEAIELAERIARWPMVAEAYLDSIAPRSDRGVPTDPLLSSQWHLINTTNPAADLNIEAAWNGGVTGAGVTVGVLEGGWNTEHVDLLVKYHDDASQPDNGWSNHATAVAGIIGATANNGLGGVGVAFGASLSRLYYGSDTETAAAFAHRNDLNAVKNNSWGPSDIGRAWTMSALQRQAITDAATTGRGGKGTVFVWAAGNGRTVNNDRVDYDPWASHPWVIAVGAVGHTDTLATYSEPGSSVMVVAPSRRTLSGGGDPGIVTTTNQEDYTTVFGGTSSSAPMAAGVVAMMLQANPDLEVRDVMHILIDTARRCDPAHGSWYLNGASRWTSDDYGFGAIDASAAVMAAQGWTGVRPVESWESSTQIVGIEVPDNLPVGMGGGVSSTIVSGRRVLCERAIVTLTLPHSSIGQLRVTLTSPSGSSSRLATIRTDSTAGRYQEYTFTSVRHWGEMTNGPWTLTVSDEVAGTVGTFESWRIGFLGEPLARLADWDNNGVVDLADLLDFLQDWFAGAADTNADNVVDLADLLTFLGPWLTELGT